MSKTELWWSIFLLQNILLGTSGGGGGGQPNFCQGQCCLKWKKLCAFRQNWQQLKNIGNDIKP